MCGGGYFKDSIILATGATGTGKTLLVSKFIEDACSNKERAILFAYEESRAQLMRNGTSWGIDFEQMEQDGPFEDYLRLPRVHRPRRPLADY
jgi:circadian clock protein KaiC